MNLSRLLAAFALLANPLAHAEQAPACDANNMRMYQMGFLTRGPAWTPDVTDETRRIQAEHLANIGRLAAEGSLLIAGPFVYDQGEEDQALRGIFIFDLTSREEALRLANTDPAVIAGRLAIRIVPWYGPCGLTYAGHGDAP